MEEVRDRVLKFQDRKVVVKLKTKTNTDSREWILDAKEITQFINVAGGFDQRAIREYVDSLTTSVNHEPQNALFKFENGRVLEFTPGMDGVELDIDLTTQRFVTVLNKIEDEQIDQSVELAVNLTPPQLQTPEVNNLGIKELIGRGESSYSHSIPGRVHNVALTATKINGVLIPPGEEFSFNKTVGDISAATGYKSAYIIKDGRTILGDGGGVCQDSTTLFRAAMNAGLPIIERKPHAYRVSYYEQNSKPGFDATVFSPSPDFKFKNDTPAYILIQATADTKNYSLVVDLYGTSDGRKSEIKNYQQWGGVPAPPPLYQDDPTLPPGTIKQVDWAAPGLKVKFDYVVTRNGETIIEKTFNSNYKPWQAVYLRGV